MVQLGQDDAQAGLEPGDAEGGGELLVCPICVTSRGLDGTEFAANARIAGATPLWEWIGDEAATVFSY